MNIKRTFKSTVSSILSVLLILSMLLSCFGMLTTYADPLAVETEISGFRIENSAHQPLDHININDMIYLSMDWKVKDSNAVLHAGDYFDVTLPDNLRFPPNYAIPDFQITNEDGKVIADAHLTPGSPDQAGGNLRVTFNDNINDQYNVKGNIFLGALFNKNVVVGNDKNTITVSVNGVPSSTDIQVNRPTVPADDVLGKWGEGTNNNTQVQWFARINYRKSDLKNAVITDWLDGDSTYVPDTFKLKEVAYDDVGGATTIRNIDLTGKLSFAADNKSFTLNLGDGGTKQYQLIYTTTYGTPGSTVKNHLKLEYDGDTKEISSSYILKTAGGTGGGELASKIKLTKVDAEDHVTPLSGAKFTVIKPDGTTFEMITGVDGTVASDVLPQGTYKVREVQPPVGYELNEEEYSLEVSPNGGALKTISDEPIRISIEVHKEWVGAKKNSAVIHLYADGQDTGKTLVLSPDDEWQGSFENLRKFTPEGEKIAYTLKEDVPEGYEVKITGSADDGFTVTNTNKEEVQIPVTKKWIGSPSDMVTVGLLADGEEVDSADLSPANHWKHIFSHLKKYADDGHAIDYQVDEVLLDGYHSGVSGTAETGFTITNTIEGKVSVPVTKKWIGKKATSSNIHLYANDKEVAKVTLNEHNQWQYTFTNLEKYEDGDEINYTIREDAVRNYRTEITGDAVSGFVVKNTNEETVSIPVKKKWVGKAADAVTVKLLADGNEADSAVLNAASQWNHEFRNLPKYDETDGHEIVYTVREDALDGYRTGISGTADTGFTITNTIDGKVSVPVTKKWSGKETGSITVNLYADGEKIASKEISKADQWQYTFTDLDEYKNGEKIKYTVEEEKISGYTSSVSGNAVDGFVITNTEETPNKPHTPHDHGNPPSDHHDSTKRAVSVMKQWIGDATDHVQIHLYADGAMIDTKELSGNNQWRYTFYNLEKYKNGREIVYSVQEDVPEGYTSTVTGDAKNGFVITNSKGTPGNPNSPGKKNDGPASSRTTGKGRVPTGDNAHVGFYAAMLLASASMLGALAFSRRKRNR